MDTNREQETEYKQIDALYQEAKRLYKALDSGFFFGLFNVKGRKAHSRAVQAHREAVMAYRARWFA